MLISPCNYNYSTRVIINFTVKPPLTDTSHSGHRLLDWVPCVPLWPLHIGYDTRSRDLIKNRLFRHLGFVLLCSTFYCGIYPIRYKLATRMGSFDQAQAEKQQEVV